MTDADGAGWPPDLARPWVRGTRSRCTAGGDCPIHPHIGGIHNPNIDDPPALARAVEWGLLSRDGTHHTAHRGGTMPTTRRALEAQIQALATKLADLNRFPETDPFTDGDALLFEMRFEGRPIHTYNPAGTYSYAALRAGGRWHLTGDRAPQRQTWAELTDWWGDRVRNVRRLRARGPAMFDTDSQD